MIGREFKASLAALMHEHNVRPIHPEPIPLLPHVNAPQIVDAIAASPDIDTDRMSFAPGSIHWQSDLSAIPLLVRHDRSRIAGRILSLDYRPDGRLFARARIDDLEAARMGGLSVCATVHEAEVRGEGAFVHGVVLKASLDHVAVTDRPANARAVITYRRDVLPADDSHDAVLASLARMKQALDNLKPVLVKPVAKESASSYHTKMTSKPELIPEPEVLPDTDGQTEQTTWAGQVSDEVQAKHLTLGSAPG